MYESIFSKVVPKSALSYMYPETAVYVDERTGREFVVSYVMRRNVARNQTFRLCPNTPTLVQRAAGHLSDNRRWLVLYHGGVYIDRIKLQKIG